MRRACRPAASRWPRASATCRTWWRCSKRSSKRPACAHDEITLRITGCPNGCGRPYLAEIGFVGKSPGKYNVYLGAAFNGSRLNILYKANVPTTEIVPLLSPIIRRYATERNPGERFGDFVIRAGYVKPTYTPHDFHEQAKVSEGRADL